MSLKGYGANALSSIYYIKDNQIKFKPIYKI